MNVRAKFRVLRIESSITGFWDGEKSVKKEVKTVVLLPVSDGSPENKAFFNATPMGEIKLGTVNAAAGSAFALDDEFYVDFTKAENLPKVVEMVDGFPRRSRLDLMTEAEKAIRSAVDAVEYAGAHPLLTDAVILLGQAKDKVSDFVELPNQA